MLVSATAASCATVGDLPALSVDTPLATAGYFVLSWQSSADSDELLLQQASDAAFTMPLQYRVPASGQLTLSGFADGLQYFRIGTAANWSTPVLVTVRHHELATALRWFLLGAVLFGLLLVLIVHGARSAEAEDA